MPFVASESRYQGMSYRRVGRSGVKLPAISLGLWQNFGGVNLLENARAIIRRAFDLGVTHFDLANNYGPPPGSAEIAFGQILTEDLGPYRDELFISTKAGYWMWPGPYGEWGSRKNLLASLDQGLKRMGLDYVDLFYSHRFDPNTPLDETMGALAQAVHAGKALYAGISNYPPTETQHAVQLMSGMGIRCLIHQPRYNIFNRGIEDALLNSLDVEGIGCIAFSPLAQGLLTDRYLSGIPEGSRASRPNSTIRADQATPERFEQIRQLNEIAQQRGQSLAQMSIAWLLRHPGMTSALIGASSISQLEENLAAINNLAFSADELMAINQIAPAKST